MTCILSSVPASSLIPVLPAVQTAPSVSKRMEIKNLIAELKKVNPHIESNIFRSVENVNLHTVIAYKKDGVKHSFLEGYDD